MGFSPAGVGGFCDPALGGGGVAVPPRLEQTDDERGADLRVHATVVAAGVALERV